LITVLETAFEDTDHVATAEQKLEVLKQMNCNFSTYYVEFQQYAADVQWKDPTQCMALMRGLNNEINDVLTLSDNVLQQF
jgi:hypothetical protein